MAETGAAPDATLMIGDTSYDIEMARAAGVHAVGVTWGYHAPERLMGAGAHVLTPSPDMLLDAVDSLLLKREMTA
jgi:phosphoglycolate phosphatase